MLRGQFEYGVRRTDTIAFYLKMDYPYLFL